jgi:hypothetical protein
MMLAMENPTMADVALIVTEQAAPGALPAIAPDREIVPLPDVLRQIGRDSQRDPQQYLDETLVPHGGE